MEKERIDSIVIWINVFVAAIFLFYTFFNLFWNWNSGMVIFPYLPHHQVYILLTLLLGAAMSHVLFTPYFYCTKYDIPTTLYVLMVIFGISLIFHAFLTGKIFGAWNYWFCALGLITILGNVVLAPFLKRRCRISEVIMKGIIHNEL
jgi:hypothetical protein